MTSKLQDRDMVVLVSVILVLVAIVLVCCKQSVPAALLVVFVMVILAMSVDSPGKQYFVLPTTTSTTTTQPPVVKVKQVKARPNLKLVPQPADVLPTVQVPQLPSPLSPPPPPPPPPPVTGQLPVKEVTITNIPVMQTQPHEAPKICTPTTAYSQYAVPPMSDTNSNNYQNLYVMPTSVTRLPEETNQTVAQIQTKTNVECIKKEIGAFPKPDRMKGNDVFLGEDTPLTLQLQRLETQEQNNSVICEPSGSSTLDAALDVSPAPRPDYNFVKPLPDYVKEMKEKIRNEGLYGIHGDYNCQLMRRSAVANTGFIQPLEARQEWLRYLAYDMPNYRNQWQTARSNTVNSDTRYFK